MYSFGGFINAFRVMPGAGIAKTLADVQELLRNPDITFIILGSITVLQRDGNPNTQFHADPDGRYTVNSVGMANLGKVAYATKLKEIVAAVHAAGKKLIVSIAAVNSYKEYTELVQLCIDCGVDGIELNFGCPNVLDGGTQHAIPSFDPKNLDMTLAHIQTTLGLSLTIPVWAKISPLIEDHTLIRTVQTGKEIPHEFKLNETLAKEVCEVLNKYAFIKAVICTNTIGGVRVIDEAGEPIIGPNPHNPNAAGGWAGKAIHKVSVAQTKLFKGLVNPDIDLIGAGGVESGNDMEDFIAAGAKAVQVVSKYYTSRDAGIFSQIGGDWFMEN